MPTAKREPIYNAGVVKAVGDALQEAIYTEKDLDQILVDCQAKCEKNLGK